MKSIIKLKPVGIRINKKQDKIKMLDKQIIFCYNDIDDVKIFLNKSLSKFDFLSSWK
ncbi:MAG: hypothetical protein PHF86_10230 [Candidatus Nanoarchaeia archaeon]|nr:hypothetical protein [Candidatus Nanoarchaeia archaeon]